MPKVSNESKELCELPVQNEILEQLDLNELLVPKVSKELNDYLER